MEIWNPSTGSVTLVLAQLPQEQSAPSGKGLQQFELLSMNYHTELIFIGGYVLGPVADIFHYKYSTNTWTKYGNWSTPICQHKSFFVFNLGCP